MKKHHLYSIAAVAVILLVGAGCSTTQQVSEKNLDPQNKAETKVETTQQVNNKTVDSQNEAKTKDETTVWKLYDPETAYGAGSFFDIQYPSDWHEITLRERGALAYHEWLTDSDACLITLGAGGGGVSEGDTNITIDSSTQNYGDLPATKKVFRQNGSILVEVTSFSRDNIEYLFEFRTKSASDYDKCKRDYEDVLATFRFL